ncbi:hypothetical protein CNMCM5793_000797 [Aspergillus hiratsukae]|uniref:Uncharacterized protein n=1 Tax=Aspergillus hiratsukae TaxID=1194566 RepID=A0A8H6PAF2_9EURO|nr:hypothetical protein CNMCM5793_000797 [Aspergillus hiratsukae]KAF7162811.1 hypothetical protein CNMCM6106_009584 [Aspergillus hiratsukae]
MAKSNIKPFHGRRDNAEDPREYIQDIEYEIKLEKRHFSDPNYDWNEDRCILFRQNLRDKAGLWYSQLDRNTKDNWALLKPRDGPCWRSCSSISVVLEDREEVFVTQCQQIGVKIVPIELEDTLTSAQRPRHLLSILSSLITVT